MPNCKSLLVTAAERKHVRRRVRFQQHPRRKFISCKAWSPFLSDAVIAAAETWLDGQPSEFFLSGLQKLEQRAKKCIELRGEYVE